MTKPPDPAATAERLMARGRVSTVMLSVLLSPAPSVLRLPAASENVLLATDITPLAVELAAGEKVAVRMRPLPEMAERMPPDTEMSPLVPSQEKEEPGSSEKEKVIVAESPALSTSRLEAMAMVGGVVSARVRVMATELARSSCERPLVLL